MSSFDKKNFTDRVNKLTNTKAQTDEELVDRFQKVFNIQPIATQKNYHIPTTAYTDDIDKEIEKMLQENDEEEDAIDDYIYSVLDSSNTTTVQQKMDGFQKILLGPETVDDETDDLIKRLQQENALDQKYQQYEKSRDDDMEKRYNALKSDPILFSDNSSNNNRPKGSIPKPLKKDELHDEMDDWCCICNDDAIIECEGCEDDNKYCKECFFHTHQSESADYEATKHKSKRYQK